MKSLVIFLIYLFHLNALVYAEDEHQELELPLKEYEQLDYENFEFKTDSMHSKRDTDVLENLYIASSRLKFRAFNKSFSLILRRDAKITGDNLNIELRYSNKPNEYLKDSFSSNYFRGIVENEPYSEVTVYYEQDKNNKVQQPLIFAHIRIINQTNETNYYIEPFKPSDQVNSKLRYIVYKSEDIESNVLSKGVFNASVCHPKYAISFNQSDDKTSFDTKYRAKRQDESKKNKNRCHLALVADHKFYKEIGNSNDKLTTAYLMNIIVSVSNIFTKTKWILDEGQPNSNYGFSIEKIIIHKEPTVDVYDHYNNKNSSKVADKILDLFGKEDWSNYCLAHLFTYQTFENSVLGLGYVSSPLPYSAGGICSMTSFFKGKAFSVNTGLSSYKSISNKQGRLLQKEAELVTAHEFGHNWGSEHDPIKSECAPSPSEGGNYLMYTYANSGNEKNNMHFSPCSINWISQILKSSKKDCFKQEASGYCGNDRIEVGEECDGGFKGRQGLDKCCEYNCRLKPGAQCSDSNHYCCYNCRIAPANYSCYSSPNYFECFYETSFCDGISKNCPSPKPKPKNTPCNSYDFGKCNENGHCNSLCKQLDDSLDECKCKDSSQRCMLCCRNVFDNGECKPVHNIFSKIYNSPLYLTDGRACFDGICEKNICVPKVKDHISRFWKVIQKGSINSFIKFMKRNIVASVIIITLFIWVLISCLIHFFFDKKVRSERRLKISREQKKYNLDNDEIINLNIQDE